MMTNRRDNTALGPEALRLYEEALAHDTLSRDNDRLRAEHAELLAALKAVMEMDDDDKVPDVMARARAAIAKAEGRT